MRGGGVGAAACALLALWLLACVAGAPVHRLCDASTYYMMTSSLVHDRDLVYGPEDLARIQAHPFRDVPAALFLVKSEDRYFYGKPFLYPLLAAPPFALFGARGFLVLNLLLFAATGAIIARFLRRRGSGSGALALAALVLGACVFPAYVLWLHPEMLNAALLTAGFFLALGEERPSRRRAAAAALVFGLAALAKSVNALYAAPWIALLAWRRRPREAALAAAVVILFAAGPSLLAALGAPGASPYGGERYVYFERSAVPYRAGWSPENDRGHLVPPESQTFSPIGFRYSAVKLSGIVAGRFSGLLTHYLPLLLLLASVRRLDGRKVVLLAALAVFLLASLFFRTDYLGGPALGNRYFHLYPAMALLADRVRWRARELALAAAAVALGLPFLVNPVAHSLFPMTHAVKAPFRWFPPEPVAVEEFFYVVRDFHWDATAQAVGERLTGTALADVRFLSREPRELPWAPGVSTFGLSRSMPVVEAADRSARGVLLDRGGHDLLLRVENVEGPEGAPFPVTLAFEARQPGRAARVRVEAGGEKVEGRIGEPDAEAEARLTIRDALRYRMPHRTPHSVFTSKRDRISLARIRIETDAPVVLRAVRAPGRDEPAEEDGGGS